MELVENAAARKADAGKVHHHLRPLLHPRRCAHGGVGRLPAAPDLRCGYLQMGLPRPGAVGDFLPLRPGGRHPPGIFRRDQPGLPRRGGRGADFIDALAGIKTVVFDKTGTLTHGVFTVQEVVSRNGRTRDQLLTFAAAAEHYSNHPIAVSIREAFTAAGLRDDPPDLRPQGNRRRGRSGELRRARRFRGQRQPAAPPEGRP